MNLDKIFHDYAEACMKIPGVEGVGIGEKHHQKALIIYTSLSSQTLAEQLSDQACDIPIVIRSTDHFSQQ